MTSGAHVKTFNRLLANTLVAGVTNSFLWFAVTFWAYLETRSVLATSIIGGSFMLFSALTGLFFGTFVDRRKKKQAMVVSSVVSLVAFSLATILFHATPTSDLLVLGGLRFWIFVALVLSGAVVGSLRMIAISTMVTLLVPEELHDKANGKIGTANGVSFAVTSVFSGLAVGQLGMEWSLWIAVALTVVVLLHIVTIRFDEPEPEPKSSGEGRQPAVDLSGALGAIRLVPGLMAIIFFTTFNNFLGGVFMALADPYGLTLVSVEAWGIIWGFLSFGFILGGIVVARRGLGRSPIRTLFLANIAMWSISVIFPIRSSIVLVIIGFFVYMCLMPAIEASEQTIIQRVVPFALQGRVFGFAQTVESAASPVTAFLIGPIAQLWVIPFMTDGVGAEAIGGWFGVGPDRGMALIFVAAGIVGLVVTAVAMRSRAYRRLSDRYRRDGAATASDAPGVAAATAME